MGTEPSRNPDTLSEADARFRYVLADPAARGRFREGMAIAESIYRPLAAKAAKPITESEAVAVMGALIGAGRSTYEAKALADLLPRESTTKVMLTDEEDQPIVTVTGVTAVYVYLDSISTGSPPTPHLLVNGQTLAYFDTSIDDGEWVVPAGFVGLLRESGMDVTVAEGVDPEGEFSAPSFNVLP